MPQPCHVQPQPLSSFPLPKELVLSSGRTWSLVHQYLQLSHLPDSFSNSNSFTVKNRTGEKKSEACRSCWLSFLHGCEEVVVTWGLYRIQVQLTVPLSNPRGWPKERRVKSQCWLCFTDAKTGGFEPWFGFWSYLPWILQEKWLKFAILVIVKQAFFWG